jgi:hypothetical protein
LFRLQNNQKLFSKSKQGDKAELISRPNLIQFNQLKTEEQFYSAAE